MIIQLTFLQLESMLQSGEKNGEPLAVDLV